jgi:integrase
MKYRLFRATFKQDGVTKEGAKWYVEFRDQLRTVRRLAGYTSKSAADELGRNLVRLVEYHSATGGQVDPALSRWLAGLPANIRERLVAIGLLGGERVAAAKPLTEHIADWASALTAKDNTPDHVAMVTGRAMRVIEQCGFKFYSDISATKVHTLLAEMRADKDGKRGISAQTSNFHLSALKQFCRWMVKHQRALSNPIAHLESLNVKVDRRRDRRALSVDEVKRLLNATAAGPDRYGMPGSERRLVYLLALETGLRSNELRSLTRASFHLGDKSPTVTVAAGYSKRRREDTLPLRPALSAELRVHLANKMPGAHAFNIPKNRKSAAKMFRADTDAAGIAFRDEANEVIDFHALRHTFITNLARSGMHPKTAQSLARHSTITLTMDRYSHTLVGEQADALRGLPDLTGPASNQNRKTGTDDHGAGNHSASCLAFSERKQYAKMDSGGLLDGSPETPPDHTKTLENTANGSVSESNRQRALFTPPTGFEDLGPHQRCKHSRRATPS